MGDRGRPPDLVNTLEQFFPGVNPALTAAASATAGSGSEDVAGDRAGGHGRFRHIGQGGVLEQAKRVVQDLVVTEFFNKVK
jgi:hypothetical protein